MTYLFDNNISPKFAKMLSALGEDTIHLREKYPHDINDEELFRQLKGTDYVFLTGDNKIRTREREARALYDAQITALFLGPFWSKKIFWYQAEWLIRRWKTIDGFVRGVGKAVTAEVKENGKSVMFPLS